MNRKPLVTATLSLAALLVAGSGGSGQGASPAPGTVVGRAVDAQGRPLAGAKVWVKPVVTTGLYQTRTDRNGRYEAAGLPPVGYRVYAWHELEYNGDLYCLRLGHKDPDDYNPLVPTKGATRDFVLKISGRMEDVELYDRMGYFGGTVSIMLGDYGITPAQSRNLEVTLTPQGPLLDGSQGKTITRKPVGQGQAAYLLDVPIGRYKATAVLLDGGARRPVKIGPDRDRMGSEATVEFKPDGQSCVGSYGGGNAGTAYLYWAPSSAAASTNTPTATTPAPAKPEAHANLGGSISGTIFAPSGGSVEGTLVIACLPEGEGCDEEGSKVAEIDEAGASASFELEGLGAGEYTVLAWQDRNGDEEVDDGDLVAVHSGRDGKPLRVRPPAANLALRLAGQ